MLARDLINLLHCLCDRNFELEESLFALVIVVGRKETNYSNVVNVGNLINLVDGLCVFVVFGV